MILTDQKKEEIREASDIVEVIGSYVELKKKGHYFVGLSPFKQEKTPSFTVTPSMGIFKDFSTGLGGDVFKFLMEIEGWSFLETAKHLAERFHVDLPKHTDEEQDIENQKTKVREGVLHAIEYACNFYTKALYEFSEAEKARSYIRERKITTKALKAFRLGYAPVRENSLLAQAQKDQLNLDYLEKAGLIKKSERQEGEYFDFFRGRLIFPIFDTNAKVIAFAGRKLGNEKGGKYINSSETMVYHKSAVLYGMHLAKQEIRKKKETILVEGYTDVISLWQAGIHNSVASSGTALTQDQLKIIKRYGERICMNYDGDAAGQNAMLRAIESAYKEGLSVSILHLPDDDDPDSYVRQYGAEAFIAHKDEQATDFIQFMIEHSKSSGKWAEPVGQSDTIGEILQIIASLKDPILIEASINRLSTLSGIGTKSLGQGLSEIKSKRLEAEEKKKRIESLRIAREQRAQVGSTPHLEENPPLDDPYFEQEFEQDNFIQNELHNTLQKAQQIPPYEAEILRLMLFHGNKLSEFICEFLDEHLFTDNRSLELFIQLKQLMINDNPIDKDLFLKDERFSELVSKLLEEKEKPSVHHHIKVGVERKRDKDPFTSARSAMKVLALKFSENRTKEINKELNSTNDQAERAQLIDERKVLAQQIKNLKTLSINELFEIPDHLKEHAAENAPFVYKRRFS